MAVRENECGMIEAKMKPLVLACELSICEEWTGETYFK